MNQGTVIQRADNLMQEINCYPEDKCQQNVLCYLLNKDLSNQWCYSPFKQPGHDM